MTNNCISPQGCLEKIQFKIVFNLYLFLLHDNRAKVSFNVCLFFRLSFLLDIESLNISDLRFLIVCRELISVMKDFIVETVNLLLYLF